MANTGSWLCPNGAARERLLDMDQRMKRPRAIAMVILALATLFMAPSMGWWPLPVCALAALGFVVANRMAARTSRPEYPIAAAWVLSEILIAAAVALNGGPRSACVAWLAIPVVTLSARFNLRGVAAGVGLAAALMVLVTVGDDPAAVAAAPELLVAPLALLLAIAVLTTALMDSDIAHRSDSVIDGLTGMLNRRALAARATEIAAQSAVTQDPVAIIIGDLDHFKSVNDNLGHAVGDAALVDTARTLRQSLRAFDLAYRFGGEEFLVLLPGATAQEALHVARQLREAVERTPAAGLPLTMSFGVASSDSGAFDYEAVLAEADKALYEAKAAGRNRVCVAGSPAPVCAAI
jgi:diguanylate cyclase (GGDEF)-like protein